MWKTYEAVVDSAYIGNTPGLFVTNLVPEVEITYGGIRGDLHFGLTKRAGVRESMYPRNAEIFNRRQITLVSIEECAVIAEKLGIPFVRPEWFGANLALRGFPSLTQLSMSSRIVFPSGAGIVCAGENLPCTQVGQVIQEVYPDTPKLTTRFVREALGRRGIVAIVERPGKIESGDIAKIVAYNPPVLTNSH